MQLETAVKASERAQALLQSERENAKAISFTDDEFKSLQLQVYFQPFLGLESCKLIYVIITLWSFFLFLS